MSDTSLVVSHMPGGERNRWNRIIMCVLETDGELSISPGWRQIVLLSGNPGLVGYPLLTPSFS